MLTITDAADDRPVRPSLFASAEIANKDKRSDIADDADAEIRVSSNSNLDHFDDSAEL